MDQGPCCNFHSGIIRPCNAGTLKHYISIQCSDNFKVRNFHLMLASWHGRHPLSRFHFIRLVAHVVLPDFEGHAVLLLEWSLPLIKMCATTGSFPYRLCNMVKCSKPMWRVLWSGWLCRILATHLWTLRHCVLKYDHMLALVGTAHSCMLVSLIENLCLLSS